MSKTNKKIQLLILLTTFVANVSCFSPEFQHFMWKGEQMLGYLKPVSSSNNNIESIPRISEPCNATIRWLLNAPQATPLLEYYADALGKPAAGVKIGATTWLGSYDECVSLPGSHYCFAQFGANLKTPTVPTVRWGLCIPKQCTEEDLEIGIEAILQALNITSKFFPVSDKLSGVPKSVHCAKPSEYTGSVIATLFVFGVILFLCFVGTGLDMAFDFFPSSPSPPIIVQANGLSLSQEDVNEERVNDDNEKLGTARPALSSSSMDVLIESAKKHVITEFFLSFSIIRNTSRIMDTNVPPGAITSINGMRVLSMFWVILGHTFLFMTLASGLTSNLLTSYKVVQRFSFQVILNATVSVDSFFFLSGLLVAYLSMRHMDKTNGRLNLFKYYFHRFWRLTPAYMLVILFFNKLTRFLGDGPLWYTVQLNRPCDKYWWTNLLYINNFYPKELTDECLGWSWYLANDMQFYIISPIFLFAAHRFRWPGLLVSVGLFLVASFSSTIGIIVADNMNVVGTTNPQGVNPTDLVYIKPYTRIAPYLTGIVLGYILHRYEADKKKGITRVPGPVIMLCGWCLAIICAVAPLYGTYKTVKKDHPSPFNRAENVMYGTFMRFSWSLGLAWVVYACHIGKGGLVNKILSARFWIPLSRLTYMAYLPY
ncbi:nose resistant to fluoxetine protein 6 isoform X3 [Nematostella vectensis]|uniref:nose resistant to fluoxetine protein 6 isoform X3 n=1 Tax=Nematostella vectensis TaxID=45351 RepID=UPI002076D851|nr:nose resistant to fluoxetine protein 6 isoform X3 [Nematostella vectensis]